MSEKFKHENVKDITQDIFDSLKRELEAMKKRKPDRDDIKYTVLYEFINSLENDSEFFMSKYNLLDDYKKHVIVTRLENQAIHMGMGGKVPDVFIEPLRIALYGKHSAASIDKQNELERWVQELNNPYYEKHK